MSNPKKNGRPFSKACDEAQKQCLRCGAIFRLRDKPMTSLRRFVTMKYCSRSCTNESQVSHRDDRAYIAASTTITQNGCWEWIFNKNHKGYGQLTKHGKRIKAHRLSYEAFHGPIPDGLMVLHSCDNPPCCNPAHLRVGTAKDNMADAVKRGRLRKSTVPDEALTGKLREASEKTGLAMNTIWKRRKALGLTKPNARSRGSRELSKGLGK